MRDGGGGRRVRGKRKKGSYFPFVMALVGMLLMLRYLSLLRVLVFGPLAGG